MRDEKPVPPVQPLPSPWLDTLLDALSHVQHSLLMVSPYIKEPTVERIQQALLDGASQRPAARSIRIITRVNPDDLLSGSSDIAALQRLLNLSTHLPDTSVEMRAIPNLHAKVWVCDRTLAIVGSGNATPSGLAGDGNLEYGLSVSDPSLIDRILRDWQVWWEQAQRVESPLLTDLASALQTIKASDDMRQLQTRNDQLRQRLKALPRVGTPIRTRSKRQPTAHLLKESPAPLSTPSEQAWSEQPLSQEVISIPIPDFWQALRWVLPLNETASDLLAASISPNANLKLIWQPVPALQQALQLIWADGTRSSQASLPAHNATLKRPWAITLSMEKLRLLGALFARLRQDGFFVKQAHEHFHLFLKISPYTLLIAYPHNAVLELPCTAANIPGSFPTLRPPLSCTTVAHKDLQRALAELKQEHPSTIIELRLTNSMLTLTTGQIEAALTRSIAATNSQLAGPETRLRIDAAALQQIVDSAPSHVETWRICVDRYADAVQFNAQPAPVGDAAMVWRHEVRGG